MTSFFHKRIIKLFAIIPAICFVIAGFLFTLNNAYAITDTYTSSGTWTAPSGVTSVTAEAWGGGGAGGGQNQNSDGGGGGGGGAYSIKNTITVIPGNNYTITVGSGGTGVASSCGGNGGDSWFVNTATVLAKGGVGGCSSTGTPPTGGVGGSSASGVGDTKYSGGQGEKGRDHNNGIGGYGGSSAGASANGWSGPQTYNTNIYPTASTPTGAGHGGDGGTANNNGISPISGYGGGGGGSGEGTAKVGGAGYGGKIVLTYTPNTAPTFSIFQPDGTGDTVTVGDSYNITYSLSDAEQTVTSAFYYDTNNSGLDGIAITGACTTAPEGTNATCSWNTAGITPGTYYVYGLTSDGIAGQVSAYSPGAITINASAVTFAITATSGANGSVTPSGITDVAQGGSQVYAITPNIGYDVETLIIDSGSVATSTTYTFTDVQATHTIHATFALLPTPPVTHTITSSAGSNGSITPLGAVVVADGANQTFNIIPDSGFTIEALVVDSVGIATSTSYTFTNVTADHTISATFALIPPPPGSFTIIANQNPNGTVAPSGSTVVTEGSSQAYTITPNSGYDVGSIIIDSSPLSGTSTSYTFTNVTADHTIEATFTAIPGTTPVVTRVRQLASVTFQGRAFPDGKISVFQNDLSNEITAGQQGSTDGNGFFNIRFTDLQTGAHSFGLLIKDPDGRSSQTKFFVVDVSRGDEIFKDIITPPTVDILNGQVSRGGNLKVFGYASPGHTVRIYINDILVKEALAGRGGVYSFDIPTGALDFGQHKIRAKQINLDGGKESDFGAERTFIVSRLTVVKADFSGDGKIDIKDWSIFLARWGLKNSLGREGIDLNSDGKVDIADFSIFIKTIRKK